LLAGATHDTNADVVDDQEPVGLVGAPGAVTGAAVVVVVGAAVVVVVAVGAVVVVVGGIVVVADAAGGPERAANALHPVVEEDVQTCTPDDVIRAKAHPALPGAITASDEDAGGSA
jgi:hypothetical protein